jgi:regulator of sirC expression with transglutaminase-like and TPR domain
VLAEMGEVDGAMLDLAEYLAHSPKATDRTAIGERLLALRERGSGPLH